MDDSNYINSIANSYHGKNFLKRMSNHDRHAELFRKDLISAMKMPDSETLQPDDYFEIIDPWKLEWERGVQVPVNVNALTPMVRTVSNPQDFNGHEMFLLPKKFLYSGSILDDSFKPLVHELYDFQKQVSSICRYDLDELDSAWLKIFNKSHEGNDDLPLEEPDMEKVMEELEIQCHSRMKEAVRTIEGLGIEYDENVVCDICRSPEGEECNEMVFCDNCDICVHQACYGIQNIPEGSWLCRTCALGIKPKCVLCPMVGGAMKSTKNGDKWAHISCALWVPEVSIGCPEKMEPITNISQIPASRWALVCTLCRERSGACIQCSVRSCKISFHVTCAFKYKLNLSTVIDDETEDVQMKAYCPKHSGVEGSSGNGGATQSFASGDFGVEISLDEPDPLDKFQEGLGSDRKSKRNKDELTEEQRSQRLKRLAEDFYTFVDAHEASQNLGISIDVVNAVHAYWTLKRKSRFDAALMTIKTDDEEISAPCQGEEMLKERMKMFIQLRQDLERVRNLCYMVNKREKMKRHERRMKEEIFLRQVSLYSRFLDEHDSVENGEDFKNSSTFTHHVSVKKFHLTDSDDDDDDFSRCFQRDNINNSSCGGIKNISKCTRTIDSDEDSDKIKSYEDGDECGINDGDRFSLKKNMPKTRKLDNQAEEKSFLMSAHKSTGTIYDMPNYVLSCSFKENHFLNNDCSFMKSAVTTVDDEDDDDDEIFPKSFRYDMKIDEEYPENYYASGSVAVGSGRGRGRPKKNKRGRPPRVACREMVEEDDDSDYYRRLSDEDFEEEIHKLVSVTKSTAKAPNQPLIAALAPPEKKRRGRKRKSEVFANGSSTNKLKTEKEKNFELPRKKRKYTRRKTLKITSHQQKLKQDDLKEESEEFKNGSSPSCQSIFDVVPSELLDVGKASCLDNKQDVITNDVKPQMEMAESEDDIFVKERSANFIPSDDENEDEIDPETRARREKAAELLKDMEFSDSSTEEEEPDCKMRDDNTEADDIIVYDVDSQDASEPITVDLSDKPADELIDQENKLVQDQNASSIALSPLMLRSSPLFTSSDDEASDADNSVEVDKNNSKVTGVCNKEMLNANSRHMLLQKLPIKDFIVTNQIKNMVQNFFSNLGSPMQPAPRLAFNGFKLPQGKIEC